jgi:hypothetical protein
MTNACSAEKVGGLKRKFALENAPCRSSLASVHYSTVTFAPKSTHGPKEWSLANDYMSQLAVLSPVSVVSIVITCFLLRLNLHTGASPRPGSAANLRNAVSLAP